MSVHAEDALPEPLAGADSWAARLEIARTRAAAPSAAAIFLAISSVIGQYLGPDAAAPWQVTFVLSGGGQVKTTWPGPFTQSGSSVKLSGAAWNRDLYALWYAKTGLTVAYTGSVLPSPGGVKLNGVACEEAGGPVSR